MHSHQVTLKNPHGLHARMAMQVVKTVNRHDARVTIVNALAARADASSVLQLLTLGAAHGAELVLEAEGPDAAAVTRALAELFEYGAGI